LELHEPGWPERFEEALASDAPVVLAAKGPIEGAFVSADAVEALLRHPWPVLGVVAGRLGADVSPLFLACDGLSWCRGGLLELRPSGRGEATLLAWRLGAAGAARCWFGGGRLTPAVARSSVWICTTRSGYAEALERTLDAFGGFSPTALGLLRELLIHQHGLPTAPALALERRAFSLLFASGEPLEGIGAFLEHRRPRFGIVRSEK
jgi:enoyl-CoA hydratase/carnithine racemase